MSENIIYEWRVYCSTDSKWEHTYGPSAPTTCPTNTAHTIIPSTATIVAKITPDEFTVRQPTQGRYKEKQIAVPINAVSPAGEYSYTDVIPWKTDVQLWNTKFYADESMVGDSFCVYANPDNIIGIITAPASIGDTVVNIDTNVPQYATKGMGVELIDDTASPPDPNPPSEYFDEIIEINEDAGTMTLSAPLTMNLSAGSKVRMYIYIGENLPIEFAGLHHYGDKGFQAKYIPKDTVLRMRYKNNSGLARTFKWVVGYYYGGDYTPST